MTEKKSNHDRLRANQSKAASGGPDYRASASGKGDVNRSRNRSQLDLGFDLMTASEEFGIESPEYNALLKQWEDGKKA
jgi:hypothetical protein